MIFSNHFPAKVFLSMFQAEIYWNPTKFMRQMLTRLSLIITKCPEEIKKNTDIDFSMTTRFVALNVES